MDRWTGPTQGRTGPPSDRVAASFAQGVFWFDPLGKALQALSCPASHTEKLMKFYR